MSDVQDDSMPFHNIARRFYNTPLLLAPEATETISAFLLTRIGSRVRGGGSNAGKTTKAFAPRSHDGTTAEFYSSRIAGFHATWRTDDAGRPLPYPVTANGTAIVSVIGELVNRGEWVGADSGLVSYEGIKHQFATAGLDPQINSIVLDLECPGGEAVGAFECAAVIREVAKIKPVVAMVNGLAASGGYALASAASRIVTLDSGISGHIGVVMVHLDFSKYLEEEGIKPTIIFSGAHKADGNPFEPLPEAVRARFQEQSALFYEKFVETVAAGRANLSAQAIRDTEALTFMGQKAVAAGLADSVGTLEEVLADLSRGSSGRSPSNPKGSQMSDKTGAAAASLAALDTLSITSVTTLAQMQAAFPALCAELSGAAALAERERMQAIHALPAAGHAELIGKMMFDGKSTAADVALAMVTAEKATREKQAAGIAAVETATGNVAPGASGAGGSDPAPAANTPEAWKAEFAKSKSLQDEYGSADGYVAFQQGILDGTIRRLSKKAG